MAQSLRPFPQFTSITALWAPDGDTWYDALQTKVSKRHSSGLSFTVLHSWQKQLSTAAPTNVTVPGTGGTAIVDP